MSRRGPIRAADLFCGAGGTSTGLVRACQQLGLDVDLLAINHWEVAIQTHEANHPGARHLCADLDSVDPRRVVPSGRLHLMVASPECTHHSIARGGRPVCDQKRASAWHVLRWAEALYIDSILVENVREFRDWGPVGANGRPLKSKRGETYQAFLGSLRSLGYRVEDRVLNAADYGDPTTRERLFILARRGNRPIRWPEPTHSRLPSLFGRALWRPAREVIDWSIPGQSIFARKRPLSPATVERILVGLERFGGEEMRPFLVILRGSGRGARGIDSPVPTVTTSGGHVGLVQPFLLQQQSGGVARSTEEPVPTVATKGAVALVRPFLVGMEHGGRLIDPGKPLPTITTAKGGAFGIVTPFLTDVRGADRPKAPRELDEPIPTLTAKNGLALIEPFLVPFYGEREGQPPRIHSLADPVPTIPATGGGKFAVVRPFLTHYYGTGGATPIDEPVPTVTAKDRFGLVLPVVDGKALDIHFRMLQPRELAAAMSFGTDYEFHGTREQRVRQIGNAVPVNLARALCRALLEDHIVRGKRASA